MAAVLDRLPTKPKIYTSVAFVLVVVAGVMGSLFAAITTDMRNRDYYRGQAQILAQNLPVNELKALRGEANDAKTAVYATMKNRMMQTQANDASVRSAYLLGAKDGSVFFFVDSEFTNSPAYVPPGTPYVGASPAVVSALRSSDQAFIEGPIRGHKDIRLSAYAPVKDSSNGRVIGLVGLDIPATAYYFQLLVYASVPLLLAAIPVAGLIRDRKLEAKEREILALKSQFVSIASHELRSPLNGLLWAVQILLQKRSANKDPADNELLSDMYRSVEFSLVTVNEILDFSIFERGAHKKLHKETVDLYSVVQEVQKTLKLSAAEKNIQFASSDEWPDKILTKGDVGALKRAFMNVVSNALKYSPAGSTITFRYRAKDNAHVIAVADQGIGIPANEQTKVLEGYYRASNAKKVQTHGTGLGLWVSKRIMEEHGGSMWLESTENQGTTVHLSVRALE